MLNLKGIIALTGIAVLLAGCSGNGDEIEPSPLVKFDAVKKVNVLWSKDIGSSFGDKYHQLTPGITGSSIIVSDTKGNVSSYDLKTGKQRWDRSLDVSISGGVGAGGGTDTAVVTTYTGDVIALSADSGEINWQVAVGGEVVSQAQLNKNLVVVQLVTGDVIALDRASGEQRWVYTSNQPNLTLRGTSSPLVALDATLVGLDNGKFVAIDNANGAVIWQHRINIARGKSDIERLTDVDGKPILYKNVIYIPGYRGNLAAINPFNAQVLWRKPFSSYRGLAASNNTIYLSADNDVVHGVDSQSAAEIWRQDLLLNRAITSPVTLADQVVVGDNQGYLHFLSQDDGQFDARYKLGGALVGDMLVQDNILYVLSNNGRLTALTVK
jgi:outer membrane protein assembly factor BamB